MENEKKWTASAARLDYTTLFKWLFIANVLILSVIALTALGVYLALKLTAPFWAVRLLGALIFGVGSYLSLKRLKGALDRSRVDLELQILKGEIVLMQKGKANRSFSLDESRVFLEGSLGEMGIGFLHAGSLISVGCLHPTMSWKNAEKGAIQFELDPSDFLRLLGELGLEEQVQQR